MNPHQKNKIDVSSLSPEEQRLFRLYGKLPSKSDHFAKHLKERKYFDSGDYAMSKAGKGDSVDTGSVGSQHPVPENIPHLSSPTHGQNGGPGGHHHHPSIHAGGAGGASLGQQSSPVKESSFLNRQTSAENAVEDDGAAAADRAAVGGDDNSASSSSATPGMNESKGIPIRR
ncbi:Endosulfine-domain-containing protein [Xylariomycetidae sp. FL2044]|nr:Endosulfine-domain-containing protein [Xylariomycetidae sp. FL2044]